MNNNNYMEGIESKFHSSGDIFALRFNEGLVFLEVDNWEQTKYAPHSNVDEAPAGGSSGFTRIEDDDDDDILHVDKKKQKVIHGAIGHSPAVLRRYTNYPESENRLRKLPNIGAPVPGDDYGYVDGGDAPYQEPTDIEELYIPPGVHLDFNFYNTDTEAHKPILNIVVRVYDINPIDPTTESGRQAAKRVVAPGSPMPIANVGSLDSQARYQLQNSWGVETISERRVRNL